jgi:phage-related protein
LIVGSPLTVVFYKSLAGKEPVRVWLKGLPKEEKLIGESIKTVQFGWPIGMPVVRNIEKNLWEIRTDLDHRIARVFMTVGNGRIILLHGFIKKDQKIPKEDLNLARKRLSGVRGKHHQ